MSHLLPMVLAALVLVAVLPVLADERADLQAWVTSAWLQQTPPATEAHAGLTVHRQDYGTLQLNQSVMKTPLKIGAVDYAHGLGTHVVSEILVTLPGPGATFTADVGIDNNYDTKGVHGSAIFVVEVAGKEAFRSGICKGGEAPVPVKVALNGARSFILRVIDDGDGPDYDQSDWAAASATLADGTVVLLDALPLLQDTQTGFATTLPYSFIYDGKASDGLLAGWTRTVKQRTPAPGVEQALLTWHDPGTGLEVAATVTQYADTPTVEWVLTFTNTGKADTPILEHILPLDLRAVVPKGEVILHAAHGSQCNAEDFLPLDQAVANGRFTMAPNGGRSSDGRLPYFNLEWPGGGLAGAIGWSGQWSFALERNEQALHLQAGQELTHFTLHAGESVRTPRILLVAWQGNDRMRGHNLLRQVTLAHYTPRVNGEIQLPPITQNTWFAYNEGNLTNEENQLKAMQSMAALGVEGYWLDAGWFEGGWPNGAGSWVPKKEAFPNGLKPLGDAAHKLGMKFVLWFEPERVTKNSRIAKEHPEWVLWAKENDGWGSLLDLGNPDAAKWLTDYLSDCIGQWGIDVYRNDFNIDPLRFWHAADAPDRQGMSEIRYVENLYAMWDELRRRHPGLTIDNCSSGGRRIDLETNMRAYPLWHSDTQCCGHAEPIQDQCQSAGLSLYVPLHAAGLWEFGAYPLRSVATTGFSVCTGDGDKRYDLQKGKAAIAETKALRPLYQGDFYPLLDITPDPRQWAGWEFYRPDLGRGCAVLFRRPQSPYTRIEIPLHGVDPDATYVVTFPDTGGKLEATGKALLDGLSVEIAAKPGSALVLFGKK